METWRIILLFAVRLALSSAILYFVYAKMGAIPFLLATPIAGVLLAKPIIEAGGNWLHWTSKQPYEEWQGRYYAFANVQIRMIEVGKELWAVDADLLRVIGEKPTLMLGSIYGTEDYDQLPESKLYAFSPTGAEKVLMKSDHYEAKRMLLWLKREVYKAHQRKLDIARENLARPLP